MAKPGDLCVTDQVVNLAAFDPGAAEVARPVRWRTGPLAISASSARAGSSPDRRAARGCIANCPRSSRSPPELRKRSLNHAFCVPPRMVCGGLSLFGLATFAPLNSSSAGGLPPLNARPPSIERWSRSSGNIPESAQSASLSVADSSDRSVGTAIAALVGEQEVEVPAVAQRPVDDQAVDRGDIVRLEAQAVVVRTSRS